MGANEKADTERRDYYESERKGWAIDAVRAALQRAYCHHGIAGRPVDEDLVCTECERAAADVIAALEGR